MSRVHDAIGGSDVSAIRGENQYKTARDVWKRIVHNVPEPEAGLPAKIGTAAEEAIINDYCARHAIERSTVERNVEIWSEAEPYFRGELDGWIRGSGVGLDAKLVLSPRQFVHWGEEGTDSIPINYLCQMGWYSMLANLDHMVVVAVIGGQARDFIYRRTPAFEDLLLEQMREFWATYVVPKVMPPAQTVDDALWAFPSNKSDVRPATPAEAALVAEWRQARADEELSHEKVELLKARVCDAIGASDGLWLGGNDRVTWKANKNGVRSLKG